MAKRIKLVLTGGGTRGIYQIGALKVLEELDLIKDIVSISGCSIGALNGALMMQHRADACHEIWKEIVSNQVFKNIDHHSRTYILQLFKEAITTDGVDLNPFINMMYKQIDEDIVRTNKRELVISVFNVSKYKLEYWELGQIPDGQLHDYLIASARLPFFKPHYINGDKYLDGGTGDNEPHYSFLENKHFDLIIKIKVMYIPGFIPGIKVNNVTSDQYIEISSNRRLGSPVEFRSPSFDTKYNLGYRDAKKAFRKAGLIEEA